MKFITVTQLVFGSKIPLSINVPNILSVAKYNDGSIIHTIVQTNGGEPFAFHVEEDRETVLIRIADASR